MRETVEKLTNMIVKVGKTAGAVNAPRACGVMQL